MDIVTYVLAKNSVNSTIPDAIEDYLDTHPIHIEEVDPTVPSWAKQPTKPSYTAQEVGAGTYSKPSGGIPKTDLASAVQTSLGKADTALQSVPNTYRTAAAQDTIDASKEDKATEVTVSTAGAVTQALDAGKIYHFTGALTSLAITLNAAASEQIAHYHFDFDCGSTAPSVSIPNTVTMPDGNSFEASKHYEVDILNNYGAVLSWANS